MASLSQTQILKNLTAALMALPPPCAAHTLEAARKRALHNSLKSAARDYFEVFLDDSLIASASNLDVTKAVMVRLAYLTPRHSIKIVRLGQSDSVRYIHSALRCLRRDIAAGCTNEMRPIVCDILRDALALTSDFDFLKMPVLDALVRHAIDKADMDTLLVAYAANEPAINRTLRGINISYEAILASLNFICSSTSSAMITCEQLSKAYKEIGDAAKLAYRAEDPEFKRAHGALWGLLNERLRMPRQEALDVLSAQLRAPAMQSCDTVRPDSRNGGRVPTVTGGTDPA